MRKLFVYICFMLLLGSNAKAYFGGNSAYGIYQLASSGNIRAMQSAIDNGSSLDAEDGNGQSPICYAIRNNDYVAYKNLVLLRADEHPSCVNRISKQEYESFKKGYEIRGGKIASSFSLGKAGMWTLAGIGTAGAAVGIAAAAGGGGGGGGSSSGGSDTPTPPPTPPTPSEPCASYDLIYCVDHGVCDECIGSRPYYKLTGCQEGYVLNTKKTGCLVDTEIRTEYPLEECDKNGTCASAKSGEDTVYKLLDCNDGYKLSSDKMSCVKICPGYTQKACPKSAQYLSETCSDDNSYHICTNRTNVIGCNDFSLNEDRCTSCRDGYKLINGECKPKCQGYTQVSCDNQTQYIKEKCTDDETYHKCASRNHSEGCDILATDSDTCLLCKEGFKLNNSNICEKLCDGYTRISCDRSQYISGYCADDASYHKCEDRKKSTTGCMDVSLTEDACQSCYDGYNLVDGVCNEICAGYTNLPCNNTLEYIKETCSENNLYHKCQNRLNIEGCSNFDTHADKCTSCDKGYELSTDGKCTQVECLGYKSAACDKPTEYISETCTDNPLFHKCKQRTNVTGCSDFKLNSDTCISCISGYSINNGICEFSCPGYTNVACNNDTQYRSSTCLKDNTYHICTWRTNTDGCATFSETSDTCTSCLQGYSLKSGRCEFDCPTMYEDECDNETQYISSVCATAPTYHICTDRKNTSNCTDYATYADECTECADEYKVVSGKCTHICQPKDGYVYTKETCDINTYYAVADCADSLEYHKCVERTNLTGCSNFSPSSDLCTKCETGYTLQSGYCNDNAILCSGYVNTECNNATQYMPVGGEGDTCPYDSSYHKCISRTNSTVGCQTLDSNADRCVTCSNGYKLEGNICTPICPGYTKNACTVATQYISGTCEDDDSYHICTGRTNSTVGCQTLDPNADRCVTCSNGYKLEGNICTPICPGYTKNACTVATQYISETCEDDDSYHICTGRTNSTAGCQTLDPNADRCVTCSNEYQLDGNVCIQICPGFYKTACNNNDQYISSKCDDNQEYHICSPRNNKTGCSGFNPEADKCTSCNDGYQLDSTTGKCIEKCPASQGYQKEACSNSYYISEKCDNDKSYHKCTQRNNSIDGCQTPNPEADKCDLCKDGYILDGNVCVEKCPASQGYTKTCDTSIYIQGTACTADTQYHICTQRRTQITGCTSYVATEDKCAVCSSEYKLEDGNCKEKCPASEGYTKTCDTSIYIQGTACTADAQYHICTQKRTQIDGCVTYVATEDKCSKCDEDHKLQNGTCVKICDGYTKYDDGACPNGQYITAKCNDNGKYLKCANISDDVKANCDKLSTTSNCCQACVSGYHVDSCKCKKDGTEENNGATATAYDITPLTSVMTTNETIFYGTKITNSTANIKDDINIISYGKEVSGMCVSNASVENNADINIQSDTTDTIHGIHAVDSSIINNSNIEINAKGGDIYGIYSDNSHIENNGNISINANDSSNSYGIYAVNNSAVKNNGVITINGESSDANIADGKFIYIDGTSYIINADTIASNMSLNTHNLGGGSIVMMSGSNITAPDVSGNLILGADITQGSNNDIYVTPNLVTGDTQNLSVSSQSAMFSASINNDNSTTDGVLTRNSFNSLIDDSSIADYLEHNYTAGNASDLFNKLKQAESLSQLNRNISDLFGQKMLARMTFEDMSMLREINLDMNDNMFKEEGAFALSGTVSPSSYANNVGSIGRYALNGFNHGKTSYALGISISDVSTYDDDKENSRSDRSFVMSAPIGYKTRGFELITSPKIGYAYGEYNRNGLDGTYNGKVYKRMYALMNEARYPLNWGKMKFTPSAEFNMIGFNVKGSEDNQKPYYLRIKPQRHYSVETGIGLTAEKEFSLYKLHNFKINGGLAFYHEFANPYELDVSMSEMDGTYRLHDEKRHDNRTVVRFGFDYELGEDVDVSASLLSNIDGEYRTDAACDIKYHF